MTPNTGRWVKGETLWAGSSRLVVVVVVVADAAAAAAAVAAAPETVGQQMH